MARPTAEEPQARTRSRLCGELRLEFDGVDVARNLLAGQPTALLCHLLASPSRGDDPVGVGARIGAGGDHRPADVPTIAGASRGQGS
jgi:hypothetical protein